MFSECPRRAGGDRTGSVLTASSAEGIGNASPSPDWARNWDHPKCIIYEFSYLFMYCRTSPCVSSAFSLRSQRILKHNSDSVWSRWFWSFYFKIISLCFTVKMISQPVWSVHVLLIQQHGCWPRDIWEEGVLWRSSHLFFPGEGRGCSSARNTSRAEGIPGITPSVLWFPPFHPPLWGCQDHLPSSPDLHWDLYLIPVWGFPRSLLCEHSSQWCRGGCKTEDNQMNPGRRGRFAALVGCNCNNLTVTQEGSTETSRQAEDVSNNRFYRWLKTHTWVWMALFSQPLSCSLVTPQFSFCQNPQVFKASADRENMEEKTVLFHRGVRILWKPSGHLMLAPSL